MPFLDILKEEELGGVLEKYLVPVRFPRDACIMRQGDPGEGCYIIDEGTVRLEVRNLETDTDSVLGFLEPIIFVGEFGLLDGKPREATAYAHTDVKARYFSKQSYDELCENYPRMALTIATTLGQNLVEKLREANEKVAGYIFTGDIDRDTDEMVDRAQKAQRLFASWTEDRVDALLKEIAEAIAAKAEELATATVTETKMGIVADKVIKIRFASLDVYKGVAGHPATGFLTDSQARISEIACPVGVVFGLIPVTNPVPTIVFKTIICLKGRNALILSCHRDALGVGRQACDIIRSVIERCGAPQDLVQPVLRRSSRQKTVMFMSHPGVALILATGGASMVKAAYSSGTPAIGVGAGNAPVLICADADIPKSAQGIVKSKSFDNGIICGSENNLVVVSEIRDEFIKQLEASGAVILTADEKNRFTPEVFESDSPTLKKAMVGKSAQFMANQAGIHRDSDIHLIVVPTRLDELKGPYGHEKLAPILSLYTVNDEVEGIQFCKQILDSQGSGHTAVIYTKDRELMSKFGQEIDASRILVNAPSSFGCIGIGTGLTPSFTLGCGTFGGTSTTDNVTYTHLLNIKRLSQNL
ncbi:MAG: aldehyde dehydrogenase family protein [Desulfobacteraceae bacterium]|nr:aldehyde dehydrogenase family protein [Desulfobacteraceae bacterium]